MSIPKELFTKSEFDRTREHPEYAETVRTADWLKGEIHNGRNVIHVQKPFLGLEFTHFPGEGKHGAEGHFAKRMGVRPYIHDFLFWDGPPAFHGLIELKIGGNTQSAGQRDFNSKLAAMGFEYRAVCYSAEEIRDTLIKWKRNYVPVAIPPRKPTMQEKRDFALELLRP